MVLPMVSKEHCVSVMWLVTAEYFQPTLQGVADSDVNIPVGHLYTSRHGAWQ